jgi:monofunctional biosynthetic peptidoglycan transglycosylase
MVKSLVQSLALVFAMHASAHGAEKTLFDFAAAADARAWQIVNDDVMGGISSSRIEIVDGVAVFGGEVSLENSGGFASVRSLPAAPALAGADAFVIRVRGDGGRYKFTARTVEGSDATVYQATFQTAPREWTEHRLPVAAFVPTFRGRVRAGEPALDAAKVVSVGFLISDRQAGPFRLEIAWIKAAKPTRP